MESESQSIVEKYPVLSMYEQLLSVNFEEFTDFTGQIKQENTLPQKCYSCGRSFIQNGEGSYYVEGFLILKSMGFPVGHAWYVDNNGQHIDKTGFHDGYYIGKMTNAEEFNDNMNNADFENEYERHDILPYHRAQQKLQLKLQQKRRKKGQGRKIRKLCTCK
jgi:hypothetical protein